MKYYTLGNEQGQQIRVAVPSGRHRQHIYHTSYVSVSPRTFKRIRSTLGNGPYTNPTGDFGPYVSLVFVNEARG